MREHFEAMGQVAANYVPLSPISFLNRAEDVHGRREAYVYGATRLTWADVGQRVRRITAGLLSRGIGRGDTVAVICPNIPVLAELHFAVPMAGAVLNAINTRLEAETVAYILSHGDAKLVIVDAEFTPLVERAFEINGTKISLLEIRDAEEGFEGAGSYETLLDADPLEGPMPLPEDEWQACCLNYTSGTSGRPKGVVYHHRGAYLMAMGTAAGWQMAHYPKYLSVVPMFHCNGWGHPWMMPIVGGTTVFTRNPAPDRIIRAFVEEKVTHFGGAPIILQMLADSPDKPAEPFDPPINAFTAGAPPPPAILEKMGSMGLNVEQVYGLTETYGHITQCLWQDDWGALASGAQAEKQSYQGIAMPMVEETRVIDRETGKDVPRDGATQGEIVIRGNTVMKGYYKNPEATAEAFENGWFWSGDGAVMHPNGYIQIKDRLKDVIISGGENISSVEVEGVLYKHPDVQAAAVVAKADDKWGEVPCACVELREGAAEDAAGIMAFCREHLAGFKTPKAVVFGELPKTSTGKIQKFVLRDRIKEQS